MTELTKKGDVESGATRLGFELAMVDRRFTILVPVPMFESGTWSVVKVPAIWFSELVDI